MLGVVIGRALALTGFVVLPVTRVPRAMGGIAGDVGRGRRRGCSLVGLGPRVLEGCLADLLVDLRIRHGLAAAGVVSLGDRRGDLVTGHIALGLDRFDRLHVAIEYGILGDRLVTSPSDLRLAATCEFALVRTLDALRAPDAADQSLREAIEPLATSLATRTGLKITCRIDDTLTPPPPVAETLRRVAQEALANIERHAAATTVSLTLDARPDAFTLTITDDGRGLPADAETRPGHYGLRGMRERVESLGGELSLSANGVGTVIRARLPVTRRQ